ncbi:response regulator [Paenibacillus sp. FSL H8-0548]|uniref:response regulator n=1 Tax=Paenibacillus sp. FSL H8-0548 TaxID=1920422 RepID=UPI0015C3D5A8|nr:response regulator [Paenibacillus sp. FSL H8-0548]
MEKRISMIVLDDIVTVIDGISLGIPWSDYGIEIVGTALDGEEGLTMAQELQPDIILTDIRMPVMDGLELTRSIIETHPSCKVILLSGFTEFTYAQQAIRLGAFDFISKPFSLEDIVEVVLKAVKEIEIERSKHKRIYEMEARVRESKPLLRQEYFNLLIRHSSSEESAREKWGFLEISMRREGFIIMVVEIDRFSKSTQALPISEIELTRFALQNILEETIAAYTEGVVFRESMNRLVVIYNSTGLMDPGMLAEICCNHCAQFSRYTVSIGISLEISLISEIHHGYQQAVSALSYNFYTGGNGVFRYGDFEQMGQHMRTYSLDQEKELLFALRSGNQELALGVLQQIYENCAKLEPLPQPQHLIMMYDELVFIIFRVLEEKLHADELNGLKADIEDNKKKNRISLSELQKSLEQLCLKGCDLQDKYRTTEAERVIHKAIKYVNSHLHLDLSVNECAKLVHLSSSYFSNLFKKVTGQTFLQFVTNERIDRAKQMLMKGHQVQEVAAQIGYEDRRYFSEIFKKNTGLTPSEFKQSYQK